MEYTDQQKETLATYEREIIDLDKRQNTFGSLSIAFGVISVLLIVAYLLYYFVDNNHVQWLLITTIVVGVIFLIFFLIWAYVASKKVAHKARYENIKREYDFIVAHPEIFENDNQ